MAIQRDEQDETAKYGYNNGRIVRERFGFVSIPDRRAFRAKHPEMEVSVPEIGDQRYRGSDSSTIDKRTRVQPAERRGS